MARKKKKATTLAYSSPNSITGGKGVKKVDKQVHGGGRGDSGTGQTVNATGGSSSYTPSSSGSSSGGSYSSASSITGGSSYTGSSTSASSPSPAPAAPRALTNAITSLLPSLSPQARLYAPFAVRAGAENNVAPSLLMAVAETESDLDSKNPKGLTGFTKETAREYGVKFGDKPRQVRSQIEGAAKYLAELDVNNGPKVALKHYGVGKPGYEKQVIQRAREFGPLDRLATKAAKQNSKSPGKRTAPEGKKVSAPPVSVNAAIGSKGQPQAQGGNKPRPAQTVNATLGAKGQPPARGQAAPNYSSLNATAGPGPAPYKPPKGQPQNTQGMRQQRALDTLAGNQQGGPPAPKQIKRAVEILSKSAGGSGAVPAIVPEQFRGYVAKYGKMLDKVAPQGMSGAEYLGKLIQFESGWDPSEVNDESGATGLGQFIDSTAQSFRDNYGVDPTGSPEEMIKAAAMHASGDYGHPPLYAGYNPGYSDTDPILSEPGGGMVNTGKPPPKKAVAHAESILGKPATKAILAGGTIVRDPDAGKKKGSSKHKLSIDQVFYDPGTSMSDGAQIAAIGGHSDHVHISADDPVTMLLVAKKAQSLGMMAEGTGENPAFDTIDAQHAPDGYHYRENPMPAGYNKLKKKTGASGDVIGGALDISGTPEQMAAMNEWAVGNAGGNVNVAPQNIPIKGTDLAVKPPAPPPTAGGTAAPVSGATAGTAAVGAATPAQQAGARPGSATITPIQSTTAPKTALTPSARASAGTSATFGSAKTSRDLLSEALGEVGADGKPAPEDPIVAAFRPKKRRRSV